MKAAMIWGDMSADRADDQYPEVAFCDNCLAKLAKDGEDSVIVHEVTYDPDIHGECCSRCGCEDN